MIYKAYPPLSFGDRGLPLWARISPSESSYNPTHRRGACWLYDAESTQAATFVECVIESNRALTSITAPNMDELKTKTKEYWEMGMNDVDIIEELRQFYDTSRYGLGYFWLFYLSSVHSLVMIQFEKISANAPFVGDGKRSILCNDRRGNNGYNSGTKATFSQCRRTGDSGSSTNST